MKIEQNKKPKEDSKMEGDSMEEIEIYDDISMAGTLDILKYNEKDYQ